MGPVSVTGRYYLRGLCDPTGVVGGNAEGVMTLEEVFDIAKSKRYLVVSTVDESGAPESALMGFALTQAKEFVFDTLSTSRQGVNLAPNPAAGVVVGLEYYISFQNQGLPHLPAGDDLAS